MWQNYLIKAWKNIDQCKVYVKFYYCLFSFIRDNKTDGYKIISVYELNTLILSGVHNLTGNLSDLNINISN
jgi:hypothetical protein